MRTFGHVGQNMQRILGALTLALVTACGQDDGGKLGGPCVSTSEAFFQCSAGLACDELGDGTCKPADSFGTLNGPCAHDPGVLVNLTCNAGLTCEIPGQNRATRCANVVAVALTPDAAGRIDATGSGLAIQGTWSAIADSLGDHGLPPGDCQNAGHSSAACAAVTDPAPGAQSFAPVPGMGMCTSGTTAQVIAGTGGAPDYAGIWGSGIAVDLNSAADISMPYNAPADHVTGVQFDLDSDPPRPPRGAPSAAALVVEFPTGSQGASAPYFYPLTRGRNTIIWPQLLGPIDRATGASLSGSAPFEPSTLLSVRFHVVASTAGAIPYTFCIDNLAAMTE